jgi:hypothetical protein
VSLWEEDRCRTWPRLEGLRDHLASVQREIFILERAGREIASFVGKSASARMRRSGRMSMRSPANGGGAGQTGASIAQLMPECGRERPTNLRPKRGKVPKGR